MLLQIRDGSVSAGSKLVLSHFDFEIRGNEKLAVTGRNGAGKSTLLRLLAGEGEIQRIAVLPECRRLGVGRKMMEAMVNDAMANQVHAISLEVRESNLAARKLYESFGFAAEAVRKGYYHNPLEDALIMWMRGLQP